MKETNNFAREIEWLLREKYNGQISDAYYNDVERILGGEPVDFVIGYSIFLGAKIDLSYKPLIPRTETEYWAHIAINKIKNEHQEKEVRVLDIFSGSGCIGIAVLKHVPNAKVDFVDIDPQMILQIEKNLKLNNISTNRYRIIKSDIFEKIEPTTKYDVVLANPPYIDKSRNITDESVVKHEPHTALFAEKNGIELIEKFIKNLKPHLCKKSIIYIEHDDDQVERIKRILNDEGYKNFEFCKDQFGVNRYLEVTF